METLNLPVSVPGISTDQVYTASKVCACGKTFIGVGPTLAEAGRRAQEKAAKCYASLPASHEQYARMQERSKQ